MNDLIDVHRNPDNSLTITIAPSIVDPLISAILMTASQLNLQCSQPQTDIAPLSVPARMHYSGRMKISADELAESLGISRRTVSEWKRHRIIPSYRIGRVVFFDVAEVKEALKRFRSIAVGEPRRQMGRM